MKSTLSGKAVAKRSKLRDAANYCKYKIIGNPPSASRAFTLIELLIVVAIIAILAAIAVPNFLEAQTRAKVSRVKADMRACATGIVTYSVDYGKLMPAWEYPLFGTWGTRAWPPYHFWVPSRMTTPVAYMSSIPLDPFKPISPSATLDPFAQRLAYWNVPYMLDSGVGGSVLAMYRKMQEVGGNYILYSFGPDKLLFNNDPIIPAQLNAGSGAVYRDYDATNGTISAGNIFMTEKNGERFGADRVFYP